MATAQIEAQPETSAKEYKIPIALVAVGIAAYLVRAFFIAGFPGVAAIILPLLVQLCFQVLLGCVACMITVKIMGAAFGYVSSAIFKLAAIFIFPSILSLFIPYVGWIIAIVFYWGLIEWLFELDVMETVVMVIVIWVVNAGALFLVALIGFGLH